MFACTIQISFILTLLTLHYDFFCRHFCLISVLFLSSLFSTTVYSRHNHRAGFVHPRSFDNGTNLDAPFWLEDIEHQGIADFREDITYQVSRNVKDFGTKGFILPTIMSHNTDVTKVMESPMTLQQPIWLSVMEDVAGQVSASPRPPVPPLYTSQLVHIEHRRQS